MYNDRRIIYNLYIYESAVIKTEKGNNQMEAKISKGVKQGCNLSPTLFNLYIEAEPYKGEKFGQVPQGGKSNNISKGGKNVGTFPIVLFMWRKILFCFEKSQELFTIIIIR